MPRDMVHVRRPAGAMFRELPKVRLPRSQFDRSHGNKLTFDFDRLVPVHVEEVLPGDTFTVRAHGFVRVFSPLKAPIMENIYLDWFWFFVPYRLVWNNWERFNGAQTDPR